MRCVSGAEIYDKNATEDVEEVQASCADAQKKAVLLVHEKRPTNTCAMEVGAAAWSALLYFFPVSVSIIWLNRNKTTQTHYNKFKG